MTTATVSSLSAAGVTASGLAAVATALTSNSAAGQKWLTLAQMLDAEIDDQAELLALMLQVDAMLPSLPLNVIPYVKMLKVAVSVTPYDSVQQMKVSSIVDKISATIAQVASQSGVVATLQRWAAAL